MARKPKRLSDAITSYDNFLYLLAELELIVGSGKIDWSSRSATATAARCRLETLVAQMGKLESGSGCQ